MIKPWRAKQFDGGYSAEFLPCGERSWRIVKAGGKVVIFARRQQALTAAKNAYLARLEPNIRATLPIDPDRLSAKLSDEAENWLKSKRGDVKNQTAMHKAGRRPVIKLVGKAVRV